MLLKNFVTISLFLLIDFNPMKDSKQHLLYIVLFLKKDKNVSQAENKYGVSG